MVIRTQNFAPLRSRRGARNVYRVSGSRERGGGKEGGATREEEAHRKREKNGIKPSGCDVEISRMEFSKVFIFRESSRARSLPLVTSSSRPHDHQRQ